MYSAIRPIATRIAGQAVRVARIAAPAQKRIVPYQKRAILPGSMSKQFGGEYGAEVLQSHPILDALDDPNAIMVRWALMYVTVVSMKIHGRAFWWVRESTDPERKGRLEIWPVPSGWMTPVHSETRLYTGWDVRSPSQTESDFVPADQIVYFYYPDFTDPLGCFSPTQSQSRAIVADEKIQEAQRRGFESIHPGVLLTVGRHPDVQSVQGQRPVLSAEQRAQLIHAIKAHYRGVARWDEPMILDGLIESATKMAFSNTEMDYMESSKLTKERITQTYGTNPVVMGHIENANRAASLSADENFLNNTVNPDIELISQCMSAWLSPTFSSPGERIMVYVEPAVTDDRELRLKNITAGFDRGAVDVNMYRHEVLGLPPVEGGNVCWIRPELVPVVINPLGEDSAPDDNPFVRDWMARPQTPTPSKPTPPAPQDDSGNSQDPSASTTTANE